MTPKRKEPVAELFVVVSHDGYLCNFADCREIAKEMTAECEHGHEQPHRVVAYRRARMKP